MKNTRYDQVKRIIKRKVAHDRGTWPHMIRDDEVDQYVLEIMKVYDKKPNNKKIS